MRRLNGYVRVGTPFAKGGKFDEGIYREYMQTFVDAGIGVYLGSAGSGEGNALMPDELRRLYKAGVATCKGKVPVHGNPPESQTAKATLENTLLAVESGVEIVNIYGPTGWHSYRPTEDEFLAFFDNLLPSIKHPVALAPNPTMGYTPKPEWIARISNKYSQVVAVNMVGLNDSYLIDLLRMIDRELDYNVPLTGSMNMFPMGAAGVIGGEYNFLPKTLRRYLDLYESNDLVELTKVYTHLDLFTRFVKRWASSNPRWIKMAMKVLQLPGADGGLREPYLMPSDKELEIFTQGLLALGIPELNDRARTLGLSVPD
jgi:dihydrodipicolinate synthase/N-acetylneuraminate lyase